MRDASDERLHRLLGGDALAPLRRRLRRHFERADPAAPSGILRLNGVSPPEYEALAALMGRRPRCARSVQINIAAIDAAMCRAGIVPSLRVALERLDGPIPHLPTTRAEEMARWAAVARGAQHSSFAQLLQTPAGLGLLKRLARQNTEVAAQLRDSADLVLQRLPVPGLPRAQIAAEVLGDAHALDNGQPTATVILAVLRQAGQPGDHASTANVADEDTRSLWARVGVLVNELARPALLLNLPMEGGGYLAGEAGEPTYATLRRLLRTPPRLAVAGRAVYVCENPNLVAIAAGRLGIRCAPLICTDGMPAAAQRTLLAQLAQMKARLLYHGDFDWPGLQIANCVMRSFSAQPWRFSAADYAAAAAIAAGQALAGAPVTASWDAALVPAMQQHGLAIPEEAVAALLLQDLER